MIELLRYARVKSDGLASAFVNPEGLVVVRFKLFNRETGKEDQPEESVLTFTELEARLTEIKKELEVVYELLALKP